MRKYLFIVLMSLTPGTVCFGQQTYTDNIQRSGEGEGTLVLHQSKSITDLVNGKGAAAPAARPAKSPAAPAVKKEQALVPDTLKDSLYATTVGHKTMVDGYRIQVYSGGNTRKGKTEAVMMGQKVKGYMDDVTVYTHFVSPHWICRVGDFRTYEEASEYFKRLRDTGSFPEAIIVRSRVAVYN